jgi:hypothetical protein
MDRTKASKFTVGMVGLAAVGLLAMTQGCSSSNGGSGTGGKGGATTGTGGHATGGAGGVAGTPGTDSGSDAPAGGCTAANTVTAPANGVIATFNSADAGIEIMGVVNPYGGPVVDTTGGNLHVTANTVPVATPSNQYSTGFSLSFNSCVDASAFTGVQFSIAGSLSGCTLTYGTIDTEHQPFANNPKGSAPNGSFAANISVAVPTTLVMAAFPATGGMPNQAVDKMKLIEANFGFVIPPPTADGGTPTNCVANLTIDDIKFY